MKSICVAYHDHCYDGFGAAFAAWKMYGNTADYVAVSYGKKPAIDLEGYDKLYVVDFCFPKEEMLRLAEVNQKVILLDHHVTAQKNIEGLSHPNLEIVFDMNRSGAGITWDYFFSGARPLLIDHIEDRDLWKFKLEGSKEVHAALVSYPMDFRVWDDFYINDLIKEGKALVRMYEQLVEKIVSHSWIGTVGTLPAPIVNTSIAWSEVGHAMLEKYPDHPFVASFTEHEDHVMWSLRSREGGLDVSALAKSLGGGGHKCAAGFNLVKV